MIVDYYLPKPTEEELNLGYKADYFERVLDLDLDKKYQITQKDLNFWVSHNFNSVFLTEKELSLAAIKKINVMATTAEFISVLHQAKTQGHIWHHQTTLYPQHKALGHFYEGITEIIDSLVESLQGFGPRIVGYTTQPLVDWKENLPEEYLKGLCVYVEAQRQSLGSSSWIQNQIDELQKFLYQIKYELTLK